MECSSASESASCLFDGGWSIGLFSCGIGGSVEGADGVAPRASVFAVGDFVFLFLRRFLGGDDVACGENCSWEGLRDDGGAFDGWTMVADERKGK